MTTSSAAAPQIDRANASGRTPVVFIHGLWLLSSSWNPWLELFEQAGYAAIAPGWPDDPETVLEANMKPESFAGKSLGEITDHYAAVIGALERKPALIGHSFGGLITQIIAGRGLASATVAIDPAPFRGVLSQRVSVLRATWPVLKNPANGKRAVSLTYEQFRYGFANAVDESEAKELYEIFAVPGAGRPVVQAATSNLNPWTEAKVDRKNAERGPLLIISGESDHTVPWAVANASYKKQRRNANRTEIAAMPNRGHSLTIDDGWQEIATTALDFVKRFSSPSPADISRPRSAEFQVD
jgi:pimeloyl-ACP methyl ester carboxylesterase